MIILLNSNHSNVVSISTKKTKLSSEKEDLLKAVELKPRKSHSIPNKEEFLTIRCVHPRNRYFWSSEKPSSLSVFQQRHQSTAHIPSSSKVPRIVGQVQDIKQLYWGLTQHVRGDGVIEDPGHPPKPKRFKLVHINLFFLNTIQFSTAKVKN